jgi:hypothetical protein
LRLYQVEVFKATNKGDAIMKKEKNHIPSFTPNFRKRIKIKTTMFDLIKTLNEVVEKGEEKFIPQIILHMINSNLLKVLR